MTVKGIKELYKEIENVEIYAYIGKARKMRGDFMKNIDDDFPVEWLENKKVADYEVMTEEDYNYSILANCSLSADFVEWYGSKDAKVLIIVLPFDFDR